MSHTTQEGNTMSRTTQEGRTMSHTLKPWTRGISNLVMMIPESVLYDSMGIAVAKGNADFLARAKDCVNGCTDLNPAAFKGCVEALRAFERGFRDGSIKWAEPRQADSDPYHPANTLMCAALAHAEGQP